MQNLTPEQYAQIVEKEKPHLVEIENRVQRLGYGTIELKIDVRAGVVEKISFTEAKTWLRPKTP